VTIASDAMVPTFTSLALNDGMGLVATDLPAEGWTRERVLRLFGAINRHASRHVLEGNRYSLSGGDLVQAALLGAPGVALRYGLDAAIADGMEDGGSVPVPDGTDWREIVPPVLRATALGRSEMGLNFGGNHFLELQEVEEVLDPAMAAAWGLAPGRLLVMYHLGPGPFASTLLHHFTRRQCLKGRRAPFFFFSKLWLHFGPGAPESSPRRKWEAHFQRRPWAPIAPESEEGRRLRLAIALATNFGFAYRMATIAAIRDGLSEIASAPARVDLVCDTSHNSLTEEPGPDGPQWVSRHNACRITPGAPSIVSGSWDVPSYLGCGAADSGFGLASHDHGAGQLIQAERRAGRLAEARGTTLRVRMTRGRNGAIRSVEEIPVRSAEPIDRLMGTLEAAGALSRVVRLRPLGTLKN
jgi:RNA-splicing ligase RtcB